MRKLIASGLVLLTCVLVQLCLLNAIAARTMPRTIYDRRLELEDQQDLHAVQVAIFGTSRPQFGVDPRVLPYPAYSFCDAGQPLEFTLQILQRQIARMPALRTVVLGIDEFTFGLDDADMDILPDYLKHGFHTPHASLGTRLLGAFPIVRHRRQVVPQWIGLLEHKPPMEVTAIEDGFVPSDPGKMCLLAPCGFLYQPIVSGDLSEAAARKRANDHLIGYSEEQRPEGRALLHDFIQTALDRKARVILLRTPMTEVYRKALSPVMTSEAEADLQTVMQAFPPDQVRLASYWDRPFADDEFTDPDHLNGRGAVHLTQLLAKDLL